MAKVDLNCKRRLKSILNDIKGHFRTYQTYHRQTGATFSEVSSWSIDVIWHKFSDFFRISDFQVYFRLCLTLSDFVRLYPTLSDSVRNGSQIDVRDYFTPKWTVTGLLWPRSCS